MGCEADNCLEVLSVKFFKENKLIYWYHAECGWFVTAIIVFVFFKAIVVIIYCCVMNVLLLLYFKVEEAVVAAERQKHAAELHELEKDLTNGFAQVSQNS